MKWFLIKWLAYAPFAFAIIISKNFDPAWVWGVIVAVCLIGFALVWQTLSRLQDTEREHKEYLLWVKEMNRISEGNKVDF